VSDHLTPSDRTFVRHFAMLIAGLIALTLALIALGMLLYSSMPKETDPLKASQVDERIMPIGADYAGSTGRAAMLAQQAAAAKAAAAQVAYGGTTDGKTIYGNLCHSCHDAGVTGAPKLGNKAEWGPRIAEGIDTLVKHAIDGYTGPDGNHMPAKGGNPRSPMRRWKPPSSGWRRRCIDARSGHKCRVRHEDPVGAPVAREPDHMQRAIPPPLTQRNARVPVTLSCRR